MELKAKLINSSVVNVNGREVNARGQIDYLKRKIETAKMVKVEWQRNIEAEQKIINDSQAEIAAIESVLPKEEDKKKSNLLSKVISFFK